MKRKTLRAVGLLIAFFTAVCCMAACGNVDISKIVEEDAPDMITLDRWGFTGAYSGIWYNQFTVNGKDGDVFFCNDASGKNLHCDKWSGIYSQLTLNSGETGYWAYDRTDGHTPAETYIDIEWKGQVGNSYNVYLGYAVIKVTNNADCDYSAEVIKSATFPTVNGACQDITRDQVAALIQKAKAS